MSIEEQLVELVGQTVYLDGVDLIRYKNHRPLRVEQDYHYYVDWIGFTSEDVVKVCDGVIFLTQEMLEAIDAAIEVEYPWHPGSNGLTTVDTPDWIRYAGYEPPFDPDNF